MDEKVREILSGLTLEEKAGLCSGRDFWRTKAVERLGLPYAMVSDGPNGVRAQKEGGDNENDSRPSVCFPSGCATASSFDRSLMRRLGRALGSEAAAYGVSVLLGPAINIKRSPLCGRNFEYLSEDPLVAGEMGAAYVEGVQSEGVGTSVKHFAANNQETNRFSVSERIGERALREIYLPGFEACVRKAAPASVMCSYNAINGVLSSQNRWLLTDVLRGEWGYGGMVVSDWGAVYDRVAAVRAGLNLEMPYNGGLTDGDVVEAVRSGALSMEELDACVAPVVELALKYGGRREGGSFDMEAGHAEAALIAEESCVLLRNEGPVLPLSEERAGDVLFVGSFAERPRYDGGGSAHIRPHRLTGALEAAREAGLEVRFARGFRGGGEEADEALAAEAVEAARGAEAVVVFAGLPESFESEGADRTTLDLPAAQNDLIGRLAAVNPRVVVVLHNGAPVAMPWVGRVAAVLECYLGGESVGTAEVRILFGRANPGGKLAETFPLRLEDTPCFLTFPGNGRTADYSEGIFVGYRWYDSRRMPVLFPFGHGLSYTTFGYSDLRVSSGSFRDDEGVEVSVTVRNTGGVDGKEVVQLYVSDMTGVEVRPEKELRAFEKVSLAAGAEAVVRFRLGRRAFAYWNEDTGGWYAPSGKYRILVGASSRDIRLSAEVDVTSSSGKAFTVTPQTTIGDMLRNREMAELVRPEFERARKFVDDMDDEELARKFPFPREGMIGMILSNPFRCNRGRDGRTMEDILRQVEGYNRALDGGGCRGE